MVYEYDRNYRMADTFEPFRQLRNGIWYDYALISPDYTRFEVVDLGKGEVVAVEPYPTITQEWLDRIDEKAKTGDGWAAKYNVGDERPDWGFCPVDFRVIDWRDRFTDESPNQTYSYGKGDDRVEKLVHTDEKLYSLTGQWALYTGCVWGDDSSWKLRYIDLSRISEGVVTSEDRFGYFPLSGSLDAVEYDSTADEFYIPVEVIVSRKSGKAFDPGLKWTQDYDEMDESTNA